LLKRISILILFFCGVWAQPFSIARLHYGGGGDWYGDPSSLPNLLDYLSAHTPVRTAEEVRITATDKDLFAHPYLYMTGHGNVRFTDEELDNLRQFLLAGAFLHADDCYGMDASFRREMKRLFPNKDLVELPHDHPLFSAYYRFPDGLPKVHEHDGKPPQALGIFNGDFQRRQVDGLVHV